MTGIVAKTRGSQRRGAPVGHCENINVKGLAKSDGKIHI